jgi:hypothetical protein
LPINWLRKETAMAKTVIEGKVETSDNRIWTVKGVADSEEDILLDFGESVNYRVVKLNIDDLPQTDENSKPIKWINNWGIRHGSGSGPGGWLDKVDYTVFLPPRANAQFAYYTEKGGVKKDKTPRARGTRPERPNMVQVDFDTGDPAAGWG